MCNGACNIAGAVAFLHIAGTPCVAWSSMGNQDGVDGDSMLHFLIWIGLRRLLQEPIIIQENVPQFPVSLLAEYLPMYFIEVVVLSPQQLGWPIHRSRQYVVSLGLVLTFSFKLSFFRQSRKLYLSSLISLE